MFGDHALQGKTKTLAESVFSGWRQFLARWSDYFNFLAELSGAEKSGRITGHLKIEEHDGGWVLTLVMIAPK